MAPPPTAALGRPRARTTGARHRRVGAPGLRGERAQSARAGLGQRGLEPGLSDSERTWARGFTAVPARRTTPPACPAPTMTWSSTRTSTSASAPFQRLREQPRRRARAARRRWVVVRQNHGRAVVVQRAQHHLARGSRRWSAPACRGTALHGQQAVPRCPGTAPRTPRARPASCSCRYSPRPPGAVLDLRAAGQHAAPVQRGRSAALGQGQAARGAAPADRPAARRRCRPESAAPAPWAGLSSSSASCSSGSASAAGAQQQRQQLGVGHARPARVSIFRAGACPRAGRAGSWSGRGRVAGQGRHPPVGGGRIPTIGAAARGYHDPTAPTVQAGSFPPCITGLAALAGMSSTLWGPAGHAVGRLRPARRRRAAPDGPGRGQPSGVPAAARRPSASASRHGAMGGAARCCDRFGDHAEVYRPATWCSSHARRRASLRRRGGAGGSASTPTRCCSTSTTRWPAIRSSSRCS